MTEVVFASSIQGYQATRVQEVADRLRAEHPDVKVEVLDARASEPVLAKYKLKFGPAVVIDGRVEFVGIPRYRMLVARANGPKVTERTAGDKATAKPSTPAATPTQPAGPRG